LIARPAACEADVRPLHRGPSSLAVRKQSPKPD